MPRSVIAIGWDVGGWRGTRQGLATVAWSQEHGFTVYCVRRSQSLAKLAKAGQLEDFDQFVKIASGGASAASHRVVLAIDAPFGFPFAFRQLLAGATSRVNVARGILDNPYAFRRTDLRIKDRFKMPLSASFDKLGNNATVAMHSLSIWRAAGLRVLPFDEDDGESAIALEVYPAVAGPGQGLLPMWLDPLLSCSAAHPDMHQRDAVICAGLAMAYAQPGLAGLPRLRGPEDDLPEGEGWIYAPESEWRREHV
jgi:hypothetical protein